MTSFFGATASIEAGWRWRSRESFGSWWPVAALGGFDVQVFEKDLTAVRGEGRHRGPIQLHSYALAVLRAIDADVARDIMAAGCVVGDRDNGLADGVTGKWVAKFDLLTPALKNGLPVALVICSIELQGILLRALGPGTVLNRTNAVDFREGSEKVTLILEDGREYQGDVLIGADGIWSKVRAKLFGRQVAQYSGFTCYSGLIDYQPPYISSVGYRVFMGFNRYFLVSDVGSGKVQWYGFHEEPPGNVDPPTGKRMRLAEIFKGWCTEVATLILMTPEPMILRRDLYDRDMIYTWGRGPVTLLGDAAHAMQPNLGQGGCMAIEDATHLLEELESADSKGDCHGMRSNEISMALTRYARRRMWRVCLLHVVSRMALRMSSTYMPYLDFGSGYLSLLTKLMIPNPTVYLGNFVLSISMPNFLAWMVAGNPWYPIVCEKKFVALDIL